MLRALRKSVTKNQDKLKFPMEMYNNVYGSVVICAYIMSEEKPDTRKIIKKWKKAKSGNSITWTLQDPNFIDRTLAYFGLSRPAEFPIAYVDSGLNCLFAPYVDGEILPLREDGIKGHTLEVGKVYPLVF